MLQSEHCHTTRATQRGTDKQSLVFDAALNKGDEAKRVEGKERVVCLV